MPFFFPPQDATIVSNVDYYIHSFHAYRTLGPLPILVMLVLYIAIYGMTFYFHQLLIVVESRRLDVQIPSVVDDMFKISIVDLVPWFDRKGRPGGDYLQKYSRSFLARPQLALGLLLAGTGLDIVDLALISSASFTAGLHFSFSLVPAGTYQAFT